MQQILPHELVGESGEVSLRERGADIDIDAEDLFIPLLDPAYSIGNGVWIRGDEKQVKIVVETLYRPSIRRLPPLCRIRRLGRGPRTCHRQPLQYREQVSSV